MDRFKLIMIQVFDLVAAECAKQEIYVLLDNHISKGMWCCSGDDGNTFWGDTYFNTANWVRGLTYMANHVSHRPSPFSCPQESNPPRQNPGPP